jgi:hypothetical protein
MSAIVLHCPQILTYNTMVQPLVRSPEIAQLHFTLTQRVLVQLTVSIHKVIQNNLSCLKLTIDM